MELSKILQKMYQNVVVRVKEDCTYISLPLFFNNSLNGISIKYYEENEKKYLTDNGLTLTYLKERGIVLDMYLEKLSKILNRFHLGIAENGAIYTLLSGQKDFEIGVEIGLFLQGITVLSQVDILE